MSNTIELPRFIERAIDKAHADSFIVCLENECALEAVSVRLDGAPPVPFLAIGGRICLIRLPDGAPTTDEHALQYRADEWPVADRIYARHVCHCDHLARDLTGLMVDRDLMAKGALKECYVMIQTRYIDVAENAYGRLRWTRAQACPHEARAYDREGRLIAMAAPVMCECWKGSYNP